MDEQLSTWMDWIWSYRCLVRLCTSTQSNNHKWVSGGGMNSPRHSKSRWLTTTKNVSIGWTNAILFRVLVHLVPLPRHLAVEVLWQNCSDAMLWCTVGSSGVEDLTTKTLLLASTRPSDEPLLNCRFIHCYNIDLGVSLSFKPERQIDRRCPHSNRRFIWCNWLRCFSSAIHPMHLETGPSYHPMISTSFCLLHSVLSAPRCLDDVTMAIVACEEAVISCCGKKVVELCYAMQTWR
jgi:hypothetical protein